jgi:hypothetical protein
VGTVQNFGFGFRFPGSGPIPKFLPREANFCTGSQCRLIFWALDEVVWTAERIIGGVIRR